MSTNLRNRPLIMLFQIFLMIFWTKLISCTPTYTENEYIAQIGAFADVLTGDYFSMSTQGAGNQFSALYDDDVLGTYVRTDDIGNETNEPK